MTEKRFSVDDFIRTYHSHIIDEKKEIITLEEYVNYLNGLVDENEFLKNRIASFKQQNKDLKALLDEMSDCNNEIWLDDGRIYRLRKVFKGKWNWGGLDG